MHDKEPSPQNPIGEVVFQDTSTDGTITIAVWREGTGEDIMVREFGDMGVVRVYDSRTGELYHEERMPLSPSAILGPGPTESEATKWSNIVSLFTD